MGKALLLGISASFFFAFTFLLNQQMNLAGGSWLWSSSLRYIFMLVLLLIMMLIKGQTFSVIEDIKKKPGKWILWSTVGFGLFYSPLSFASSYGPSWLVAGTWQITIICGALLSPLFFKTIDTPKGKLKVRNKLPKKSLFMSLIILIGIFLIQFEQAKQVAADKVIIGIIPVIIAAFSYPLGNRKMMEICSEDLNTFQRVFGMTLCSMPFWIFIALCGIYSAGLPSSNQILQSAIVALFSGIIATILFFKATDLVKHDIHKLAVVESTQSGEVIFTLLGAILVFHDRLPTLIAFLGIALVITGMILNSLNSN
ncbi:multidrug resistance efflux transporter family protein [Clostridium sp. 19966]|uniref:DMT family transporter n=1 Tax=Clostridium sp. 19966 TaxID=2768166 RepID=UPI0028DDA47E|nr:multidrug resistance efflux transporter family protein [Clostridium sp. 19966]MDT8716847.1 multidrug resistance efflux transporter family protein [Clostridium sp. 19966]